MAQKTIIDIFEECIVQLNQGQSIDDCLRRYPDHASRLRPMLETVASVHDTQVAASEMYEDQALVWQRLDAQLTDNIVSFPPRRRPNIRLQLLIALLFLLLATMGTWFFMTRPDSNEDLEIKITVVASPTMTASATSSPTMTASPTVSPTNTASPTATATNTALPSETATMLPLPTGTAVPSEISATSIPSSPLVINTNGQQAEGDTSTQGTGLENCAAPFTLVQVVALVAELYPTATINYAIEVTEQDTLPVWEVETDQGLILTIDAVCGDLLYVEEIDFFIVTPNPTTTLDDDWYEDETWDDDETWYDDDWYEDETWDDEDYYDEDYYDDYSDDEWYDDETWDDDWYEDETWDDEDYYDEDYYDDYSDDEWYDDEYDG